MYVVGGAAMALAYASRRSTRDVDAVFEPSSPSTRRSRRWPKSSAYRSGG